MHKTLFLLLFFCNPLIGTSAPAENRSADWKTRLAAFENMMEVQTYEILSRQLAVSAKGEAPKIADPMIKSVVIAESEEALVDVRTMKNDRITMLPSPETPFASPEHNSGFDAAAKIRRTVFLKLQFMLAHLDRLATDFGYLRGQIDIKVFEGLRGLKTQEMLFNNKAREIREASPSMSEEEIFSETSKWVSPVKNNTPVHSTGGAVDIRLWDNKANKFIDMGPFGVIWGKNTTAPTFTDDLTDEQKNNRLFQVMAATQAGLINYLYEYWHYSSGDRYASYWQEPEVEKRKAVYDSI